MNGSLYDENPASGGGARSSGGQQQANNSGGSSSADQQDNQQQQLSPSSQQQQHSNVPVSASGGPLHIPAKRLGSSSSASGGTLPGSHGGATPGGSYGHHSSSHSGNSVDPNGSLNGSTTDSSGLLRAAQPWPYSVGDVAAQHAAATGSFDPQSYSPSSKAAAAAAAYYGADRAKAALSFWPSDYGKYGAAAAGASSAAAEASAAQAQFNAQAAWCNYAGYGSRVPEPHGVHPGLGPAPGQPGMGVPVSVAGYLAAEAHEVRRGAMDAAAAVACGFPPPHDSYAGLRGYAPGPDGMPPSVYGPGKFFFLFFLIRCCWSGWFCSAR